MAMSVRARPAAQMLDRARVALERGDCAAAADHALTVLARDGTSAEAWLVLGDAARRLDQGDAAREAYLRALTLRPHDPAGWFALATLLTQQRRFDEAIRAFRTARGQDPARIDTPINLALLHFLQGDYDAALTDLTAALQRDADNPRALLLAARVQQRRGRLAEAEALCRHLLSRHPTWPDTLLVLGRVLYERGEHEQAAAVLTDLVGGEPDNAEAHHERGVALKALGRLAAARAAFDTALHLAPGQHATYAALADLVDFAQEPALADRIVAETHRLAAAPDRLTGPNDPLIPLQFAAGKALDDRGDHAAAIRHYTAGAALKRATLAYDEAREAAFCDAIKQAFTREFLAGHGLAGDPTQAPVFIVGMARSGSTLVEQILASHGAVHGGEEALHLPRAIAACAEAFPGLPAFPALAGSLRDTHVAHMARSWCAASIPDTGAARVTDKLLTNFYFVGLIAVLFPSARIINTLRDPVDTCVSAYATLFAEDMPYTYDFGELARYYDRYCDLMAHWRDVLPAGMMTTVHYEDIVRDLDGEARRLVDFIGLDWDDRCLSFHSASRAVSTASVAQVRRPMYTRSIGRGRRHGAALDPLLAALEVTRGKLGGI
jgi:tetratricopeptide (TPR) repeat protein